MSALVGLVLIAALAVGAGVLVIRSRNMQYWLPGYLRRPRVRIGDGDPLTVCVAVCDHYEPAWRGADLATQRRRVEEWMVRWPALAARHRDSWGRPPQHTFFFPLEEYLPEHLDRLAELCRQGIGDVEVHLHHDRDTPENLRRVLLDFTQTLHDRHGLLRREADGRIGWGFIHGNWALDNSRPDGRYCGINNELRILRETGCYADFTFPSAPSDTQPATVNSIYYATDDPERPKSHDRGVAVRAGGRPAGDLLLIQGPLALNWRRRKWGVLPRIENGDLSGDAPPSPERANLWARQHIHVEGRRDWMFIKLHAHGAQEKNFEALLGAPMEETLSYLERTFHDGRHRRLLYVTAREMYQAVMALQAGTVDAWTAGLAAGVSAT